MSNKKILKIIGFSLSGLVLGYMLFSAISSMYKLARSFSEDSMMNKSISKEYADLFRDEYKSKIDTGVTYFSKVRHPVTTLSLDKNYPLLIFKMDLTRDVSLPDVITEVSKEYPSPNTGIVYNLIRERLFNLIYLSGKPSFSDSIYFYVQGDSIKTVVSNDSMVGYHLYCRNFSLAYKKDGIKDIAAYNEGFEVFRKFPVNLLFLKRDKALYFLLMSVKDKKLPFKENQLLEMIRIPGELEEQH